MTFLVYAHNRNLVEVIQNDPDRCGRYFHPEKFETDAGKYYALYRLYLIASVTGQKNEAAACAEILKANLLIQANNRASKIKLLKSALL